MEVELWRRGKMVTQFERLLVGRAFVAKGISVVAWTDVNAGHGRRVT
jgi:hypothetical protein